MSTSKTSDLRSSWSSTAALAAWSCFRAFEIDLFGLFPFSAQQSLLCCCDFHLTRYVIAALLPTGSSAEITNISLGHDAPRSLLSDGSRPFLTQVLREVSFACYVTHTLNSGNHPQTNKRADRRAKPYASRHALVLCLLGSQDVGHVPILPPVCL